MQREVLDTASMRRIALIMLLLRHASSVAVRTALRDAVAALNHAKVPEAQASAEWLLAHALGASDRTAVQRAIAMKRALDASEQAQFSAFVERRLQREPVQYIVGKWAFHDIELELEPPTLIPRSGRGVQALRFVRRGDGVEACESAAYAIAATGRGDGVEGLESAACAIDASTESRHVTRHHTQARDRGACGSGPGLVGLVYGTFCGCRLRERVPRTGFTKQAAGRLVLHGDRHLGGGRLSQYEER